MGEELAVCGGHGGPVDAVHVGGVEAFAHLHGHIVKHRLAFGGEVNVVGGGNLDGGQFVTLVELLDVAAQHENLLARLVGLESGGRRTHLGGKLGLTLAQGELPEVVAVIHVAEEIKGLAVAGDDGVGERRAKWGEAHHAVLDAVKLDRDVLGVGFLVIAIGLFPFLVFLLVAIAVV